MAQDVAESLRPYNRFPSDQHLEARQLQPIISVLSSVFAPLVPQPTAPAAATTIVFGQPAAATTEAAVPAAATTPAAPAVVTEQTPAPAMETPAVIPAAATTQALIPAAATTQAGIPAAATTQAVIPAAATTQAVIPAAATTQAVIPAAATTQAVIPAASTAPIVGPTLGPNVVTSIPVVPPTPGDYTSTTTSTYPSLTPIAATTTIGASPTPTPTTSALAAGSKGSSGSGSPKGKTLGIALGVSLGVVAIALLAFLFFCFKRRRRNRNNDPFKRSVGSDDESFLNDGGPSGGVGGVMRQRSKTGGSSAIEAIGAGAAIGTGIGAAENIARRSRQDSGYGSYGDSHQAYGTGGAYVALPHPHQMGGNRGSGNGDYVYGGVAGSGDAYEDGRRGLYNTSSSRQSLPLEAVSESPDEYMQSGMRPARRSLTDQNAMYMAAGRPGSYGNGRGGPPPPSLMAAGGRGRYGSSGPGRRSYTGGTGPRPPPPQYYEDDSNWSAPRGPVQPPPVNTQNFSSHTPPEGGELMAAVMAAGSPGTETPPRRYSQASPATPEGSASAVRRKPISGGAASQRSFDFGLGPGPSMEPDEPPRFYS
jgi:hypothetical protein